MLNTVPADLSKLLMDEYKRGAIVRIKCKGFLTYRTMTELRPGPRLNMVLGPNGTGKSSIVCAICIGLGGHPKLLGRSVKLADYVAHNESVAMIEIELHNPDGANRTIWRQLTRKAEDEEKVTSAWRIDGAAATELQPRQRGRQPPLRPTLPLADEGAAIRPRSGAHLDIGEQREFPRESPRQKRTRAAVAAAVSAQRKVVRGRQHLASLDEPAAVRGALGHSGSYDVAAHVQAAHVSARRHFAAEDGP